MSRLYRPSTTFTLPNDWSPEQALAVHDILETLLRALWARYEHPLRESLLAQGDLPPHAPLPLSDVASEAEPLNDEIPF
jgi:hypothetical protein